MIKITLLSVRWSRVFCLGAWLWFATSCGSHLHPPTNVVDAGPGNFDAGTVDAGSIDAGNADGGFVIVDLGALSMPAAATARDGAASGPMGTGTLWVFGDTLFDIKSSDGQSYRSNTAAFGTIPFQTTLQEPLDDAGAPFAFFDFTPGEQAYNDDGGPDQRIALWPGSVIEVGGVTRVAYQELYVNPGTLNYQSIGSGWATAHGTHATRDPALLFQAPEPQYALAAVAFEDQLYLYACTANGTLDTPCTVARAPTTQADQRSAFTFWNGSDWVSDYQRAATVFSGAPGDVSVSWNAYLGQFIAVHSEIFGNRIFMHTAPRPEGPWSDRIELFTAMAPGAGQSNDYAGKEHGELSQNGGRTLLITYAHPLSAFFEEVRAVSVSLP
jgi:hypothetical protein